MIAEKAEEAIEKAVAYELQNIVKKYGAVYASNHEAYAVLKEECEEAAESLDCVLFYLNQIWNNIRKNLIEKKDINLCKEQAKALAGEAVQCAAVCERFVETLEREEKHEKLA